MNDLDVPIPVALITGFLGAGKTTLLNHILKTDTTHKFVVIENEVGDMAIDKQLIANQQRDMVLEIAQGCICCSVKDELIDVLLELAHRNTDFNYVLIETTGIADPASVVQAFLANPELKQFYRLDNVICMADAKNLHQNLQQQQEAYKQLVFADTVILNKTDLVEPIRLQETEKQIRILAPTAQLEKTQNAKAPISKLINTYAHSFDTIASQTSQLQYVAVNHHHHTLNTYTFILEKPLNSQKFERWIKYFLYLNQSNIYRAKGILYVANEPQKIVFQAVRDAIVLEPTDYWPPQQKRQTTIVFIGKQIKKLEIHQALQSLL